MAHHNTIPFNAKNAPAKGRGRRTSKTVECPVEAASRAAEGPRRALAKAERARPLSDWGLADWGLVIPQISAKFRKQIRKFPQTSAKFRKKTANIRKLIGV